MYCIIMNKLSYIKRYHINPSHFGFLKPRVWICLVKLFSEWQTCSCIFKCIEVYPSALSFIVYRQLIKFIVLLAFMEWFQYNRKAHAPCVNKSVYFIVFFCRATLCTARPMPSRGVRPSVCLLVTFVYYIIYSQTFYRWWRRHSTLCSKKHVTTFSMISWSRTIRLQRFLAHLLPRV